MNYLLDTHTLIWFINGDSQLSAKAKRLIEREVNRIYFSMVTPFEIAIKINVGKLNLTKPFKRFLEIAAENDIQALPIKQEHLFQYASLSTVPNHRDPFDRLIIATAAAESLTIITADPKFALYKSLVKVEW